MKNLLILSLIFLFFTPVHSQSKIQIEKERALYRDNKVKIQTIDYPEGRKEVTKFNKNGAPIESHDYYDSEEVNATNYIYDKKGFLIEQTHYGYYSGDGDKTNYYYNEQGDITKTKTVFFEDNETFYEYGGHGNLVKTKSIYTVSPDEPSIITEYNNISKDEKLIFKEIVCGTHTEDVKQFKFNYEGSTLVLIEEFTKNCFSGTLMFTNKTTIVYFPNGLTKEVIQNQNSDKDIYTYEFY